MKGDEGARFVRPSFIAFFALCTITSGCVPGALSQVSGDATDTRTSAYGAWVTSESTDEAALVRYDGSRLRVERTRRVGSMAVEIDGPHGVAVGPEGRFLYVTIGHGRPNGFLWKIDLATDELVAATTLALFPATVALTPDGEYGFVSNFNLHGDHVPSSISRVHLPTMAEVNRIETCTMPHGSRVSMDGTRHYSVCMMDDLLVEIDVRGAGVRRAFSVRPGEEGAAELHAAHQPTAPGAAVPAASPSPEVCSPTWAEPSHDGRSVFVTCNRTREVLEIDVATWAVRRRLRTGDAPYNLAVTPDGRLLLITLRSRTEAALEIVDLADGRQLAHLPTTTTLAHGVAITPDSRFAFVSVEGVGAEPGRVDLFDLSGLRRIATVAVGQQATGIAVAN